MLNNNSNPITKLDIDEFIQSKSDFGFEIKVKQAISELGIVPLHGGTYIDPVTQKTREYDFRFTFTQNCIHLHASVECKNISEYSPVLVSCLPRSKVESKLRFFLGNRRKFLPSTSKRKTNYGLGSLFHPLDYERPPRYPISEPCGKAVNQVSRSKNGKLSGGDADVFDSWSQAVSSIITYSQEPRSIIAPDDEYELHIFMPFVVFPDDRLWFIAYNNFGEIIIPSQKTDNISIYINKFHKSSDPSRLPELVISHIEFMTLTGFKGFIEKINNEQNYLSDLCPTEMVDQRFP